MLSFFERVKTWWTIAEPKQKVVTLGGIGALLLVLLGTAVIATRPHYETLFQDLSDTEKASMVEALKAGNGEFDPQIGRAGAIELPAAQIPAARLKLATAGKLPKGANHWGPKEILSTNPLLPPGTEDEILNTVREGEIASALEAMRGVASANVLITRPKDRLFATNENHPTASVSIVESGEGELTGANGRTIANLVCSAVDGMTPADVVVVSNSLGELWNGRNGNVAGTKWDQDSKVSNDLEAKIQAALDFALGRGNTKVLVRADVNTDERTIHERQVDPTAKPIAEIKDSENAQGARKGAGGTAGATANTTDRALATPSESGGGVGNYEKKGTQKQYDKNEVERDTKEGAGGLKGMAITVIANSDKVPDEAKVKTVVDGVMGGLVQTDENGVPKRNQPFTTTVTSVKFDGSSALVAKEAADRLASQQRTQQILSLLPIAAILAVALLVAKQVGRISRSVLPAIPDETSSLAEGEPALEDAEGQEALPTPGTPSLPSPQGMNGGMFEGGDLSLLPETIRDRIDLPLESLKQMAADRPEMVATLIKSVMLGERN